MPHLILLLFTFSLSSLSAKSSKQNVHLLALQTTASLSPIYLQNTSTNFVKVELSATTAAHPVSVLNTDGVIQIFGPAEKNENGVLSHSSIGEIKCDPSWKEAYVVLSTLEDDDQRKFKGEAFSLLLKDLPDGAMALANLTPLSVKGRIGSKEVSLKPSQILSFVFKDAAGEMIDVGFQYQRESTDEWRRMIATRWPVPQKGRRLLLMFPKSTGKGVMTKTIPIRQ
ncbi:MAG: hypothetical protein ACSHYB_16625 [Roseibacillus sp.]